MSNVIFCLGLFSAIYGFIKSESDINEEEEDEWKTPDGQEIPSPKELFGILALVVGILAVITGLLGCLAARCLVCGVTAPYMFLSMLVMVFMFSVAIFGIGGQDEETLLKEICRNPDNEKEYK